ncbi:MAG: DUF192 domain-containing protein [Candidatus Omnitrophota bacterium]
MRIILLIILILCLSVFALGNKPGRKVCFDNDCFEFELANTDYKRYYGLMFRKFLDIDKGMLFVFDKEDQHKFWMKNMNFPLDIIWIAKDKKIVDIHKNALPCKNNCESLIPGKKAKYVLELNSGVVDRSNIKIGDKAKF